MKECFRTKSADVNVAVFSDISIVPIGTMGEDRNTTGTEAIARVDSVANRRSGVVATVLLSLPRGFRPFSELNFPVSRHYRHPIVYGSPVQCRGLFGLLCLKESFATLA